MSEKPGNENGLRKIVDNSDEMAAIGNLLKAMEGMQEQIAALTDLVVSQDQRIDVLKARIEKLEFGPAPIVDIRGRTRKSSKLILDN